jgi:hypothetical protein
MLIRSCALGVVAILVTACSASTPPPAAPAPPPAAAGAASWAPAPVVPLPSQPPPTLDVSPRVGHIHVTVDDAPWHWADGSGEPLITDWTCRSKKLRAP